MERQEQSQIKIGFGMTPTCIEMRYFYLVMQAEPDRDNPGGLTIICCARVSRPRTRPDRRSPAVSLRL